MAIKFNKLRDPKLGMQDTIAFGKLKGCRVCDCILDHYEYLIWAEKQGYLKFQPIVIETVQEQAGFKASQRHQAEEVDPYLKEYVEPAHQELDFSSEDIPF